MRPRKCKVCDEAQSKYKCPSCLIPYCSLACFKKHEEVPCVKTESSSQTKLTSGLVSNIERPYLVDESNEVLQQLQLESIVSCSEIRDALKDEELQKLIHDIDCSQDAENELNKAMKVEVFHIFTDKILSTISPQQRLL
ncbi:uncharacterized protein LOC130769992 [Actinidia eriantha]|uniref:uncharacterized protein LOC130769992 n=1 Tax=Actinidia eriantha TaxID=165200 RepID=UPI0025831FA8|nr:uncharacterized protein LOC130769992 [Actinidia eriantha]